MLRGMINGSKKSAETSTYPVNCSFVINVPIGQNGLYVAVVVVAGKRFKVFKKHQEGAWPRIRPPPLTGEDYYIFIVPPDVVFAFAAKRARPIFRTLDPCYETLP